MATQRSRKAQLGVKLWACALESLPEAGGCVVSVEASGWLEHGYQLARPRLPSRPAFGEYDDPARTAKKKKEVAINVLTGFTSAMAPVVAARRRSSIQLLSPRIASWCRCSPARPHFLSPLNPLPVFDCPH